MQGSELPLFVTPPFTPRTESMKSPLHSANSGIEYFLSDPAGALSLHQHMCDPDRLQQVVEVRTLDTTIDVSYLGTALLTRFLGLFPELSACCKEIGQSWSHTAPLNV